MIISAFEIMISGLKVMMQKVFILCKTSFLSFFQNNSNWIDFLFQCQILFFWGLMARIYFESVAWFEDRSLNRKNLSHERFETALISVFLYTTVKRHLLLCHFSINKNKRGNQLHSVCWDFLLKTKWQNEKRFYNNQFLVTRKIAKKI